MFGNESLAAILQQEVNLESSEDQDMCDIQDSPRYKSLFRENCVLAGQRGGMVVGLEADGVAPFHSFNQTYSFTVVTMPVFNLMRNVRMLFRNIFLVMIIPGDNRSEALHQDAYFEILVDELLYLTKFGKVKDYTGAPIKLKIELLLYILDYPGFNKLFHLSGSGAIKGCIWCEMSGIYCKHISKTVYLQNRSYLIEGHYLTSGDSSLHFPVESEEMVPPKLRSQQQSLAYAFAYENAKNKAQASSLSTATGIKGTYPFIRLPGHDRLQQSIPDGMHTVQRCLLNIYNLITGKDDSVKIRLQEKDFKRFSSIWPVPVDINEKGEEVADQFRPVQIKQKVRNRKKKTSAPSKSCNLQTSVASKEKSETNCYLPKAPYLLKDREICNHRFYSVVFPFGTGIKMAPIFTSATSLNFHDWKELAFRGIFKYYLRDQLQPQQEETLFLFLDCISRLFEKRHNQDALEKLEFDLNEALALVERDFPVYIQNITQHLLHHLVEGIRNFGPLYSTWMYSFERFNGWCSNRAINKKYPESTIIETYLLYDFSQLLAASGVISRKYVDGENIEPVISQKDCRLFQLSKSVLTSIFNEYCNLVEELNSLWKIYQVEVKRKITEMPFYDWNPQDNELSPKERELTKSMSPMALECTKATKKDMSSGRIVTYTSYKTATEHSDSSVVCHKENAEGKPLYGRIMKIFEHQYMQRKTKFCVVELFDGVIFDERLKLYKCEKQCKGTLKTYALENLRGPNAYAVELDMTYMFK